MNIIYDGKRRKTMVGASVVRYDGLAGGEPAMTPVRGRIAEEIAAQAREHGLALHEDAALVAALARLGAEPALPREVCAVLAELLAFIYAADAAAPAGPAA